MKRKSKSKSKSVKFAKNKNMVFGYVLFSSILAIGILLVAGYYSVVPLPQLNVLPATGTTKSCTFTFASEKKVAGCEMTGVAGHYSITDYKSGTIYYNLDVSGCTGGGIDLTCSKTTIVSQHY